MGYGRPMLFQILPWVSSRLVGRATSKLNVAARGNLARNCTELEVCVVEGANEGVARDPRETGAPCPYWSTWLPSATLGWNIHRMKVNSFPHIPSLAGSIWNPNPTRTQCWYGLSRKRCSARAINPKNVAKGVADLAEGRLGSQCVLHHRQHVVGAARGDAQCFE